MKKLIIVAVAAVLLIIGGISFSIYHSSVKDVQSAEEKAASQAKKEFNFKSVTSTQPYFGNHAFYVVEGTNRSNQKVIAWMPKSKKQTAVLKKASSGITKEKAISIVKNDKNPQEIKSVRLGIEKKKPLWEVTYVDKDKKHLTYYYLDFSSGEFIKRYSLSQS
ncbi:cell wall elongation regulator TseB-like domain-containing protein [Priestia megaterium]|uniref:cell wall elongation regulator TseB-like domain-containing protein n=1 Tax=Priestia megaterium TaxID=1404 RepID=UPI000BF9C706|nr:DUF5590 domain-containing protein [Priestia megaterium]PFQ86189.1 hypothetical protein COK11_05510 [Priestia megaterium]UYT84870.1 DUF5590 domain-containing protein [Priestia megaterium]WRQ93969.1 DUF5590 domain-containing protein [Priestia megaterium]